MIAEYQNIQLKKNVTFKSVPDGNVCIVSYQAKNHQLPAEALPCLQALADKSLSYSELLQIAPESVVEEICVHLLDYGLAVYEKEVVEHNVPLDLLTSQKMEFMNNYRKVRPFTMLSPLLALAVYDSVLYIIENGIAGDLVFTGVWRGGAACLAASLLVQHQDTSRTIYLYDTFDWTWPDPSLEDYTYKGRTPSGTSTFVQRQKELATNPNWLKDQLVAKDQVTELLLQTGYPEEKLYLVDGYTEEVLNTADTPVPNIVAFAHLDTDFYTSTKVELEFLYPRLVEKGILIVDDYGTENGATKALNDYVAPLKHKPFLHRIDYQGVLLLK